MSELDVRPEQQHLARLHKIVARGARALRSGRDWEAWLYRAEPLMPIKFANTMLIWAQRPQATKLLSYNDWQQNSRQVNRGEHGIWIIAEPGVAAERNQVGAGARASIVFDLPQTHGVPVPLRKPPYQHAGQPPSGAWDALASLAFRSGFRVEFGDCAEGDAFVSWRDRRIHVRRDADEPTAVTALAHQLGHVLLHGDAPYLDGTRTLECRGVRRVEADSITVLVAARLGMDTPSINFPYVSSWAGTDERAHPAELIQAVGDRILRAAAKAFTCLDAVLPAPITTAGQALDARAERTAEPPARANAGQDNSTTTQRTRAEIALATASTARPRQVSTAARLQAAAEQFYTGRLRGSWASVYLESRGLGESVQQDWHVGYAPAGWTTFTDHLRDLGYKDADIETAGLARRSSRRTLIDTFRDRAIFPVRTPDGTVAGFIGRASPQAGKDVPKYLNSPGTELYSKGDLLFGLHEARSALARGAQPVIVEGPLDAIAVSAADPERYAGLAPCGTALTPRQVAALAEITNVRETGILVALDSDQAGQKAALKAYEILRGVTEKITAVVLPAGQDPAGMLETAGRPTLAAALADLVQPLADLVIDANIARWDRWLEFIQGRFNALRSTAPLIAQMPPEEIGRQVARVAQRLNLEHSEVTSAVTDAISGVGTLPEDPAFPRRASGDPEEAAPSARNPAAHAALGYPHSARYAVRSAAAGAAAASQPARTRPAGTSQARAPKPHAR
ncbi:MAG: toprim domain-containing protein [Streptosporangiaceae bacterium]